MKYLILIFTLIVTSISAQDYVKDIEIDKGNYDFKAIFSDKNKLFFNVKKLKFYSSVIGNGLNKLYVFDLDKLDLKYVTDFDLNKMHNQLVCLSNNDKYFVSKKSKSSGILLKEHFILHDEKGEGTPMEIKDWLPKDFTQIKSYLYDENFISIGHTSNLFNGRKNQIFSRNLKTLKEEVFDINIPNNFLENITTNVFRVFNLTDKGFMALYKSFEIVEKTTETQNYLIVEYDYKGNVLNTIKLPVVLDLNANKIRFCRSNNDNEAYVLETINNKNSFNDKASTRVTVFSSGMVLWDDKEQVFYTYSTVLGLSNKEGGGYQINKFSKNGSPLWSKYIKVYNDIKGIDIKGKWSRTRMKIYDDQLFFYNHNLNGKDYYIYFSIDKNSGELKKTSLFNFKRLSQISSDIIYKDVTINNKTKKLITGKIMRAKLLSKSFENYFENLIKSNKEYTHSIEFKNNSIIVIENDVKEKKWRLLKFNL